MNVLPSLLGDFWATYQPKTPHGIYCGEWVKNGVKINRVVVERVVLRMISRTGYQALCKGQNQGQN